METEQVEGLLTREELEDQPFSDGVTLREIIELVYEAEGEAIDLLNTDMSTKFTQDNQIEIELSTGQKFIVMASYEKMEELAKQHVLDTLETEPEIFNKEWLEGLRNVRLDGQSFNEYAVEQAVQDDGPEHFLNSYDGSYNETKKNIVYWRQD